MNTVRTLTKPFFLNVGDLVMFDRECTPEDFIREHEITDSKTFRVTGTCGMLTTLSNGLTVNSNCLFKIPSL